MHNSGCSWNINFEGNEASDVVKVSIETQVRPLPLLDAGASLLGMTNDEGNITLKVEQESKVQPSWITNVPAGTNPRDWVGAWLDDKD